jgi:hypothetical protein
VNADTCRNHPGVLQCPVPERNTYRRAQFGKRCALPGVRLRLGGSVSLESFGGWAWTGLSVVSRNDLFSRVM